VAGQAPVNRDYLLGHIVGGDAVAAGLLGEALAVVSAYYQRLAEQTRGHGITADGVAEEIIPVDRGLPGHGGPLLLPD
jgi:hypothetical protein